MSNQLNPDNYPGLEFGRRYRDLYNRNCSLISWYEMVSLRISRLELAIERCQGSGNEKRFSRLIRMVRRQRKISTARFKKMTTLADQLRIDVAKEQAKYIACGYSFRGNDNSDWWGASVYDVNQSIIPMHTGLNTTMIEDDKSPIGFKIPITFNKETKEIKIGVSSINVPLVQYNGNTNPLTAVICAFGDNGFNLPYFEMDHMGKTKAISWFFGSKADNYIRKLSYHLWTSEYNNAIKTFCRNGRGLSSKLIIRLIESKRQIDYLQEKKLNNLIPAVIFYNEGLSKIKSIVGNRLWKIIANNTVSRNDLLFRTIYKLDAFVDVNNDADMNIIHRHSDFGVEINENRYTYLKPNPVSSKRLLEFVNELPTSILKKLNDNCALGDQHEYENEINIDQTMWAIKIAKEKRILGSKCKDKLREFKVIYRDTKSMAESINAPFSDSWSYRTMLKKHNEYALESAIRNHVHFDFKFKNEWPDYLEFNGVSATLLKSSTDLLNEGIDMRHCVASYWFRVQKGHSIIYSLKHIESGLRSTLEIEFLHKERTSRISQNRGFYNKRIKDAEIALLVDDAARSVLLQVQSISKNDKSNKELMAA